jgi:hypothetical protein
MNKYPKRYWLTYTYTWPFDILIWVAVLVLWALWGTKLHWLEGLWFEFKPNSWPMRTWYKRWAGTTLGHGGFLAPGRAGKEGIDTSTEFHEHIHVEQYEGAMFQSFIYGVTVFTVLTCFSHSLAGEIIGGAIWLSGGMLSYGCSATQAWLRGESWYMGGTKEESAYAQTKGWNKKEVTKS